MQIYLPPKLKKNNCNNRNNLIPFLILSKYIKFWMSLHFLRLNENKTGIMSGLKLHPSFGTIYFFMLEQLQLLYIHV